MSEIKPIRNISYTDDTKEKVGSLVRLRLPWLIVGLIGGTLASFLVSRFGEIISQNISLAFFLPLIVYMSDAVGNQTENIFVRRLSKGQGRVHFLIYLFKELLVGLFLGSILGFLIWFVAIFWIQSPEIAFTVGLAMFINVTIAPVVALIVPEVLFKERTDPALGAGPFTTIIQDIISILIYFVVASVILFG